ncbi:MAG: flavin oxidoreductase/NADH oxidase, partial [Clostridiales bacterium]|nr:flavin oxidoreductase/NADH oxidase [Clostridiales bacterium]
DTYLDGLVEKFVASARLAKEAGFDGVDMKSCHGYLLQELLSAYLREGKYGGSFENRTRLYLTCVREIKKAVSKDFIVASRLGITDMVQKPYGFGTDENNNIDLTEPKKLISEAHKLGVNMINVTLGNPYFNPHVNRPFRVGPYKPEESAETGLERFIRVEKELKETFPDITFIGSGLSYYRGQMMEEAEKMLTDGVCDLIGFGRVTLAYPAFYSDHLSGKFDAKKCCVTCSKCTELMRNHQIAGCAVFNEYYRDLYKNTVAAKKEN